MRTNARAIEGGGEHRRVQSRCAPRWPRPTGLSDLVGQGPYGDRREERPIAAAAAITSEDAPTRIPMGCSRKRTSITYAATPSIACLVTNFTSAPARPRVPAAASTALLIAL